MDPEEIRRLELERPPFLRALALIADPLTRLFALDGLERLGERGEAWRWRLKELVADPHPPVALRATAALVRHAGLERLREAAATEPEVFSRALAVRWLRDFRLVEDLPLFARVLAEDHATVDDFYTPAAAEAAHALVRM